MKPTSNRVLKITLKTYVRRSSPCRRTLPFSSLTRAFLCLYIPCGEALHVCEGPLGRPVSLTGLGAKLIVGPPAMPLNGQEKWTHAGFNLSSHQQPH
ncbi:hypothetical protein INR49_024858 [Caranx melampygus]|nr:hypothetical protein INR49_024858 [Caranx melampygus]